MNSGQEEITEIVLAQLFKADVYSEITNRQLAERIVKAFSAGEYYINDEGVYKVIESESTSFDDGYYTRLISWEDESYND